MDLLTTLRLLNEKRTKGPWSVEKGDSYSDRYPEVKANPHIVGPSGFNLPHFYDYEEAGIPRADADFICASANAMSRLLDVIDAARDVTDLAVNWPKLERLKVAFQALEQADD